MNYYIKKHTINSMKTIVSVLKGKVLLAVGLSIVTVALGLLVATNRTDEVINGKMAMDRMADALNPGNSLAGIANALKPEIADFIELDKIKGVPVNRFTIRADRDTVVIGKKGIQVFIPQNSFAIDAPNALVDIELKEYTTKKDLMLAGLSTVSNGKLIESGGSVYLNVTNNGKDVKLKDGAMVSLAFPTARVKPGMQTFYGKKDGKGAFNWEANNQFADTAIAKKFRSVLDKPRYKLVTSDIVKYSAHASTLTTSTYQVQALGSHKKVTCFKDTATYKNVLDYFEKNFHVSKADCEWLDGSYFSYTYMINNNGKATKPRLSLDFHEKLVFDTRENRALKLAAIKRLRKNIENTIAAMQHLQPTRGINKEYVRIYFDHKIAKSTKEPTIHINDKLKSKIVQDYSWELDSVASAKYLETVGDRRNAGKARHDYKMKNDGHYYFLNASKLGFINCDMWPIFGLPVTMEFNVGKCTNASVYLVFTEIMSIYGWPQGAGENGYYKSVPLPVFQDIKIIVVDNRKDGLYYCIQSMNTSDKVVPKFVYKPMTVAAVKYDFDL
jgi:hypothetical protein